MIVLVDIAKPFHVHPMKHVIQEAVKNIMTHLSNPD